MINYIVTTTGGVAGRSPYPVPAQLPERLPAMCISSESSWVLLLPLSDEIKNSTAAVHTEAPGQRIWAPIVKPFLSFSNYWLPNELNTKPRVSHYVIMGSLEMRMSSMWHRLSTQGEPGVAATAYLWKTLHRVWSHVTHITPFAFQHPHEERVTNSNFNSKFKEGEWLPKAEVRCRSCDHCSMALPTNHKHPSTHCSAQSQLLPWGGQKGDHQPPLSEDFQDLWSPA